MHVILLKYCEGRGRGGEMPLQQPEYYFDVNLFICFFVSFFLFLMVRCLFLIHLREQFQHEWNIVLRYLFLCVCICLLNIVCCTTMYVSLERNVKGRCSRPNPLSYYNKQSRCDIHKFSRSLVQRKLKEKVANTHKSG